MPQSDLIVTLGQLSAQERALVLMKTVHSVSVLVRDALDRCKKGNTTAWSTAWAANEVVHVLSIEAIHCLAPNPSVGRSAADLVAWIDRWRTSLPVEQVYTWLAQAATRVGKAT